MTTFTAEQRRTLDERLSQRFIALDPAGYFLIKLDRQAGELIAEHYGNGIDERGLATDPDTGEESCTERGCLRDGRHLDGETARIRQCLHESGVAAHAPVDP